MIEFKLSSTISGARYFFAKVDFRLGSAKYSKALEQAIECLIFQVLDDPGSETDFDTLNISIWNEAGSIFFLPVSGEDEQIQSGLGVHIQFPLVGRLWGDAYDKSDEYGDSKNARLLEEILKNVLLIVKRADTSRQLRERGMCYIVFVEADEVEPLATESL